MAKPCEKEKGAWVGTHCGFQLRRKRGSGAYGSVYEAVDPDGNVVALKILKPPKPRPTAGVRRRGGGISGNQLIEAAIHATIQHENLMTGVYVGYDCKEKECVLTASPLADMDLWDYIHGQDIRGSRDLATRVSILCGVKAGLDHLHLNRIAHLDVKPENILLTKARVPKLGDFGLSERVDLRVTPDRMPGGTLHYQSPDQLAAYVLGKGSGDGSPSVEARSRRHAFAADIWALGIVAFELLFGVHPFSREAVSLERDRSPAARSKMLSLIAAKLGPMPTTWQTHSRSLSADGKSSEMAKQAVRRASRHRSCNGVGRGGKSATCSDRQFVTCLLGKDDVGLELAKRYTARELEAFGAFFKGVLQYDPTLRIADTDLLCHLLGMSVTKCEPPTRQRVTPQEEGVVSAIGKAHHTEIDRTLAHVPQMLRESFLQVWSRICKKEKRKGVPSPKEYLSVLSLVTKLAAFEDDRYFWDALRDLAFDSATQRAAYREQHRMIEALGFNFDGNREASLSAAVSRAVASGTSRYSTRQESAGRKRTPSSAADEYVESSGSVGTWKKSGSSGSRTAYLDSSSYTSSSYPNSSGSGNRYYLRPRTQKKSTLRKTHPVMSGRESTMSDVQTEKLVGRRSSTGRSTNLSNSASAEHILRSSGRRSKERVVYSTNNEGSLSPVSGKAKRSGNIRLLSEREDS